MERRKFLKQMAAVAGGLLLQPSQYFEVALPEELEGYLKTIKPESDKWHDIVEENDIFKEHKSIPDTIRLNSFDMYFPMYKAGQDKYDIDWKWAFVFHGFETGFSQAKNPWASNYFGPLQTSYDPAEIKDAITGWEFLRFLPQRYRPETVGFYDCDGIMTGMRRMRYYLDVMKNKHPNDPSEILHKRALRWYCGDDYRHTFFGDARLEMSHQLAQKGYDRKNLAD